MLIGILLPVAALVIMGWIRHDRMLTTLVVQQTSLNDRLERVEETLDVRGIRP